MCKEEQTNGKLVFNFEAKKSYLLSKGEGRLTKKIIAKFFLSKYTDRYVSSRKPIYSICSSTKDLFTGK